MRANGVAGRTVFIYWLSVVPITGATTVYASDGVSLWMKL